jgi:hypothetical protein
VSDAPLLLFSAILPISLVNHPTLVAGFTFQDPREKRKYENNGQKKHFIF